MDPNNREGSGEFVDYLETSTEETSENSSRISVGSDDEGKQCNNSVKLLEVLYSSVLSGDVNSFDAVLTEITRDDHIDLNSSYFEDYFVADIHKSLTALQLICGKGDKEMLQKLIKLNIDVNNCGKYGKTPLNIACLHGHLDLVNLLILRGVDVNASNVLDSFDTALITVVACYQSELESADKYYEIGKILLEAGACCNLQDKDGLSALQCAVTKSDDRLTTLLLTWGANPDITCAKSVSTLCRALQAECFHNAKLLLKHGCKITSTDEFSRCSSPLYLAVAKNNLDIILTLLQMGADPNECSKHAIDSPYQFTSALHLAASEDRLVTLWLLLSKGGDTNSQNGLRRDTPLLILARKGSTEGVKMLLRFGADVDVESQVGTTAVWAAVRESHSNILHILFETCCSLETPSMEYHMYMPLSPLEIALRLQSWNMALLLLNAGASYKASTLNDAIPAPVPLRGHRIIRTRAAYRLTPEDHKALKELRTWRTQPKMLAHLCRAILRSFFKRKLPALLLEFNYPKRLQQYLFMKE